MRIRTILDNGQPPSSVLATFTMEGGRQYQGRFVGNEILVEPGLLPVRSVELISEESGYWGVHEMDLSNDRDVIFLSLPTDGPLGWWHEVHGVSHDPCLSRGGGIRVGIIDEALAPQGPESCIRHVENLGLYPAIRRNPPRGYSPLVDHGHAVTSLLASRCSGSRELRPGPRCTSRQLAQTTRPALLPAGSGTQSSTSYASASVMCSH